MFQTLYLLKIIKAFHGELSMYTWFVVTLCVCIPTCWVDYVLLQICLAIYSLPWTRFLLIHVASFNVHKVILKAVSCSTSDAFKNVFHFLTDIHT